MIITKDDPISELRKRVREDKSFFTMEFPSYDYPEDVFESQIEHIVQSYEDAGYSVEKVIFFVKNKNLKARINMRDTETDPA